MSHLIDEEQYSRNIRLIDIDNIKDPELRAIRQKYAKKRLELLKTDSPIPDELLDKHYQKLKDDEQLEINKYRIMLASAYSNKQD